MNKPKEMFLAIFVGYKYQLNSMNLIDIRSRKSGVITDNLIFKDSEIFKIPKNLQHGDYVAFLANLEFKDVEFMNIFDLGKIK